MSNLQEMRQPFPDAPELDKSVAKPFEVSTMGGFNAAVKALSQVETVGNNGNAITAIAICHNAGIPVSMAASMFWIVKNRMVMNEQAKRAIPIKSGAVTFVREVGLSGSKYPNFIPSRIVSEEQKQAEYEELLRQWESAKTAHAQGEERRKAQQKQDYKPMQPPDMPTKVEGNTITPEQADSHYAEGILLQPIETQIETEVTIDNPDWANGNYEEINEHIVKHNGRTYRLHHFKFTFADLMRSQIPIKGSNWEKAPVRMFRKTVYSHLFDRVYPLFGATAQSEQEIGENLDHAIPVQAEVVDAESMDDEEQEQEKPQPTSSKLDAIAVPPTDEDEGEEEQQHETVPSGGFDVSSRPASSQADNDNLSGLW